MTSSMIDPRPFEPAWVSSIPLPDEADWTILRHVWDREAKRYQRVISGGSGDAMAFMKELAGILSSKDLECQITVDATGIVPKDDLKQHCLSINYPTGYDLGLFWSIRPVLGEEETGTCTDELFSWVEYLLEEQKAFEVELSYHDFTG